MNKPTTQPALPASTCSAEWWADGWCRSVLSAQPANRQIQSESRFKAALLRWIRNRRSPNAQSSATAGADGAEQKEKR